MTIQEIKSKLSLAMVFARYGWQVDRNNRLHCPFHEDKTPSMQVYWETGTVYCFSTNCPTHGHSLDVIELVAKQEQLSKKEAINFCKAWIHEGNIKTPKPLRISRETPSVPHQDRVALLSQIYQSSLAAFEQSKEAQAYARSRKLANTQVGYIAKSSFAALNQTQKIQAQSLGLLQKVGGSYQARHTDCLVFALRNSLGEVVDFYFRSLQNKAKVKHYYLPGAIQGIYPRYPSPEVKKLIIFESVIDCASFPDLPDVSKLALYGTGGFTETHATLLSSLDALAEITLCFDGDESGRKAAAQYQSKLSKSGVCVRILSLPKGKDVNSIAQEPDGLHELRKLYAAQESCSKSTPEALSKTLTYQGISASFQLLGKLCKASDSLKVSLLVQNGSPLKYRSKVDLYEDRQVSRFAESCAKKLKLQTELVHQDLDRLTDYLEKTQSEALAKAQKLSQGAHRQEVKLSPKSIQESIKFWQSPDLMEKLNANLGICGLVGEELSRLFTLVILSSYKQKKPLHVIIHGSSGSGKTHMLEAAASFLPRKTSTA